MYKFFLPTKIIFGTGTINLVAEEVKVFAKKVLIVCGKKSVKETGVLQKVMDMFERCNIEVTLYDNIPQDPSTEDVQKGLKILESNNCDCVVSIGGGSVIDVGKAVAGLYTEFKKYKEQFSVEDYLEIDGKKKIETCGIPFVAVPTISGTGAEVTMNAVLVNPKTNTKRSIRSEHFFAKLAIIDPSLTVTVPPYLTTVSSVDALCHLVEGYISKKSNPLCDSFAVAGIKYIIDSLPKVVENPKDISLREKLVIASLYGGVMIVNSGLTLAHGIGAVIGVKFNLPHGIACAISLPYVLKLNLECLPKYKIEVVKDLFTDDPDIFLERFFTQIGIPTKVKLQTETNFVELAQQVLNTSSAKANPKDVSLDEVVTILKKIFY